MPAGVAGENPYAVLPSDDLGLITFAERRLRERCMADRGFPQYLGDEPESPRPEFLDVRDPDFLFDTEERVRRRGFGPGDLGPQPVKVVADDPAFAVALQDCEQQIRDELGDAENVVSQVTQLVNAFGAALSEAHEQLWAQSGDDVMACVEDAGWTVADPAAFDQRDPIAAFGVRLGAHEGAEPDWQPAPGGGVQVGPAQPARRYVPTQEEAELAVALFRCKDQTGFASREREVKGAAQRQAVADNESELAEVLPRVDALAERAAAIVAKS